MINFKIKKHDIIETMHDIPVNRPVHPLPDFEAYDSEEYTDVKRLQEQLINNKSYSIPNVYLEPDQIEPQLNKQVGGYIKGQGGRKTNSRGMAKINTFRKKERKHINLYMVFTNEFIQIQQYQQDFNWKSGL